MKRELLSPEMLPFWQVVVFLFGACIGSFLNVCIYRIPRGETVVTTPSHCPKCDYSIAWYDNIPLLSWTLLNGKCRKCRTPISYRYFMVELITAILFSLIWFKVFMHHQPIEMIIPYFIVLAFTVTTSFIDYDCRIIPNETTYSVAILGLIFSTIFPIIHGQTLWYQGLCFSFAGLLIGGGCLLIFSLLGKWIFKKDALGLGDVKYIAAIGACLGWQACFATVLFGSILGSIIGLGMILCKGKENGRYIPFGPFLAIGTIIWMIYGKNLFLLYYQFLMR